MSWLTSGKWFLEDEATGADGGGAGAGAMSDGAADGSATPPPESRDRQQGADAITADAAKPAGEPVKPKTDQQTSVEMAEAMTKVLRPDGDKAAPHKPDAAARKADQSSDETSAEDAAKRKSVADATLLKKTPDDFKLSDQDRAGLGIKGQSRFQELTHWGKLQYERAEQLAATNVQLTEARDTIMGALDESGAGPQQLANLLRYSKALASNDVQSALSWLNAQREAVMRVAGIEGEGVDLLKHHKDLAEAVENGEITRAHALEVVQARNLKAHNNAENARRQRAEQQAQASRAQQDAAVAGIEQWCRQMAAKDPAYKAKEQHVLQRLQGVIRDYSPGQWLPTLRLIYDSVTVAEAKRPAGIDPAGDPAPLRPSGTRTGPAQTNDIFTAMKQHLRPNG